MSVSQLKLSMGCLRRWGFKHLLKLKEEMGVAAGLGDGYHHEMEMWCKVRRLPTSKPALAALRYAPAPGVAEAECAVYYIVDGAPWIGFIDLCYDWEGPIGLGKGSIKVLASTGHTVIHDWKFTGNINGDHVLTEDGLRADEAANLYALEAYMGGAKTVSCRWVYVQMKGSPSTKEVWVEMPLESVVARIREMSQKTVELHGLVKLHKKGELNVLDLECDTGHCFDFRKDCPYKVNTDQTHARILSGEVQGCNPMTRLKMPALQGESKMEDFKTQLANFPGAGPKTAPSIPPKTPPAVPGKPAPKLPPKLPPKTAAVDPNAVTEPELSEAEIQELVESQLKAQGKTTAYHNDPNPVVERGFVNSLAAPTTPAANPEEAAAAQDVKAKDETVVVIEDDLTNLNKDQLRGICPMEGIELGKKRPSEDTLRGMIRAERIKRAAGAPATAGQEAEEAFVQVVIESAIARETQVDVPKKTPALPMKATVTPEKIEYKAAPLAHQADNDQATLELHQVMDSAHTKLYQDTGKRDYRHIQYTGAADLCLAVQDLFEDHTLQAAVVVFDSRTPEGSTLKTTLLGLSRAGHFKLVDGSIL